MLSTLLVLFLAVTGLMWLCALGIMVFNWLLNLPHERRTARKRVLFHDDPAHATRADVAMMAHSYASPDYARDTAWLEGKRHGISVGTGVHP